MICVICGACQRYCSTPTRPYQNQKEAGARFIRDVILAIPEQRGGHAEQVVGEAIPERSVTTYSTMTHCLMS